MKVATNETYYEGLNDPYIKNIPFNDQEYLNVDKKKYTIGYFKSL